MKGQRSLAFTGGGTAGHILPGLAIIKDLKHDWNGRIVWIGSRLEADRFLIRKAGIEYYGIPTGKWRRYLSIENVLDIFKVAAGLIRALGILMVERPLLVFSKGGFVSVPVVIAARILGLPVITHESDFDPGMATKINARVADWILTSYSETKSFLPDRVRGRVILTGNPIRGEILKGSVDFGRRLVPCVPERPLILVLGGSLGASGINDLVVGCLDELLQFACVVHQMGKRTFQPIAKAGYLAVEYIYEELPDLLAAADLIICRAGANTLSELAALGKPAVLIPLPVSASRGDQIRNARYFASHGGAVYLKQEDATSEGLLETVRNLLNNVPRRRTMSAGMRNLGDPEAVKRISEIIKERAGL